MPQFTSWRRIFKGCLLVHSLTITRDGRHTAMSDEKWVVFSLPSQTANLAAAMRCGDFDPES
jgi:hypothetical protein